MYRRSRTMMVHRFSVPLQIDEHLSADKITDQALRRIFRMQIRPSMDGPCGGEGDVYLSAFKESVVALLMIRRRKKVLLATARTEADSRSPLNVHGTKRVQATSCVTLNAFILLSSSYSSSGLGSRTFSSKSAEFHSFDFSPIAHAVSVCLSLHPYIFLPASICLSLHPSLFLCQSLSA